MIRPACLLFAVAALPAASFAQDRPIHWVFDNLEEIGELPVHQVGDPIVEDGADGPAVLFDGKDDALYMGQHPLAGAAQFTAEAIFRPDGGAFEQRWMHLASDDPTGTTRILFEIRVVGDQWYLDSFMKGENYAQVLIDPARLHPVGQWYHVAQTFDGTHYRSYVDGVLECEAEVTGFTPQMPGNTSIGVRYNRVDYFNGAIREARFTDEALDPSGFLPMAGD